MKTMFCMLYTEQTHDIVTIGVGKVAPKIHSYIKLYVLHIKTKKAPDLHGVFFVALLYAPLHGFWADN